MEKITQTELIAKVAQASGITKKTVKEVLDNAVAQVIGHVGAGCAVSFAGIGKFYPKHRTARTGRNPITGSQIEIPAKKLLAFKPAADKKEL
jgi:DNA-binding protein HU-beta